MRTRLLFIMAASFASGSIACADDAGTTTPTPTPTLAITSPTAGTAVAAEAFDVAFTVTNFTLKAPGTCAGATSCGHVHLLVDGAACNAAGVPYNAAGAASPVQADLGLCATTAGAHTVTLELHHDDHSPVLDGANVVAAHVAVTFAAATGPAIAITSPAPGATVDLGADFTVPVAFTASHFTLAAPGACAGAADCGHVHLLVDGADCNGAGAPYNNAGAGSSLAAKLALCATADGEHDVTLELHHDDHSPVKGAGDATVSASVTFTVAVAKPRILIVSPAADATVTPSGATKTVPIAFKVAGFTLKAAGTCGANTACGHAHLLVDGEACNTAGAPYNNDGEASPIDAILSECDAVPGAHTVTVELHKDNHAPLQDAGSNVQATVTFTAQ